MGGLECVEVRGFTCMDAWMGGLSPAVGYSRPCLHGAVWFCFPCAGAFGRKRYGDGCLGMNEWIDEWRAYLMYTDRCVWELF